jgi:hypothetical protein
MPLPNDEEGDGDDGCNEESDYSAGFPGELSATPLNGNEKHNDRWEEKGETGKIEMLDFFSERKEVLAVGFGVEEEEDRAGCDGAKWEIDIKA